MKHRTLLGRTRVSALKRFIYRPPCEPAINYLVPGNDRRNERAKLIQFNTRASARIRDRSLPPLLSLTHSLSHSLSFSLFSRDVKRETNGRRATYVQRARGRLQLKLSNN